MSKNQPTNTSQGTSAREADEPDSHKIPQKPLAALPSVNSVGRIKRYLVGVGADKKDPRAHEQAAIIVYLILA
jgi:hypothetical protein